MPTSHRSFTRRTLAVAAALAALLAAGSPARAQLSGSTGTTTGSTCSGGGSSDGDCRFSRQTQTNTTTQFKSRYAWNVNADVGVASTHDTSGNAQHNLSFSATAVGGYRLDIDTQYTGAMNRRSDLVGCDGASNVSGVSGSSNIALSSGSLSIGDPGSIGNGGGDSDVPFNSTNNAIIFRVSNSVPQSHSMTFTWNGQVRSNSCEAAVRIGESSGTTTDCEACGYPGNPSRSAATDGHFVTVTFTSLCGNGAIDASAGEQCDQGGANGSATSCCTSQCQFRGAGQVCRTGGGAPCDLNETCTGSGATCPADDAPGKNGNTCRVGSGDSCDPDEVCNGVPGVACPADVKQPNGTLCRAGSGDVCDPNESCTGIAGQACPANVVNGPSTTCRVGSGDSCDTNEVCTGVAGAACPGDDAPINAGTVCRSGSGDVCDVNETCTGTPGATCPADDAPAKLGTVCRPSSAGGSFCDLDETCLGLVGSTCPPNDVPAKTNVVCRPGSGDVCDPDERCTGILGQGCPADVVAPPTTVCRTGSGDSCDPDETCTAVAGAPCPGNVVTPAGTTCRASAGVCDVAESCTGTTGATCPANGFVANGTPCNDDTNLCTVDTCQGSAGCVFVNNLNCNDGNVCTQDSCNPGTGCVISGTPSNTCLGATKASLQIRDKANDASDSLKFSWKGGPVTLGGLGDPTQTTRFELCVYDASGVQMALGVNPGAGWKAVGSISSPKGYLFKDRTTAQSGVKKIKLGTSTIDRAKLQLQAKGVNVPNVSLPFLLPVSAQLYSSTGSCWEMDFGALQTKRNQADLYKGKLP